MIDAHQKVTEEERAVADASFYGGQTALKVTAIVPLSWLSVSYS